MALAGPAEPGPARIGSMERIYLDHNATTPVDASVLDAMLPALRQQFGNASSTHWFGQHARALLERARGDVADLIGATPQEIVFTGSGTEADNLALRGVAAGARAKRRGIVYSGIEHHAVMNTAQALAKEGYPVEVARVLPDGRVDLDDLASKLSDGTALVCLMLANNETGAVQPVADAARLAHEHGALLHCDAVQGAGKIPIEVEALGADLLALSAHKFYGPKGVGALYVRRGTPMKALIRGGGQERNRRAGTENVAGVAGLGRAAVLAREAAGSPTVNGLRDALEARLLALPGANVNGTGERIGNTTNVSFDGADAEGLVMALDLEGVAVSTGAACAAGAIEPSHVLRAMGMRPGLIQGSLRFSLGRSTTAAEIERAVEAVATCLERQRALAR